MCDPGSMALASLALTTASGVSSYMAQSAAADAQEEYNAQLRENAKQAYQNDLDALRLQQEQDVNASEEEILKNQIEARQTKARAKTAAGEAGVSGLSVSALLNDYNRQEAAYKDSIEHNLENRHKQRDLERTSAHTRYKSRVNSIQPVNRPSLIGTGLSIASEGLGTYSDYKRYQDTKRNT